MNLITPYLGSGHARCDSLLVEAETRAGKGDWEQTALSLERFRQALERHFRMEEDILFPAFEEATGNTAGPTAVMRMEHRQIRAILVSMQDAQQARDADSFLGHSETLNIMMQQHNLKEEGILYPMADRALSGRLEEIIEAMDKIEATT